MRRINNYSIEKESIEEMVKAGRFNPCLEISFWDRTGSHTHKLSAGYDDVLDVYREGLQTYVLSHNHSLGYVGLEIFKGSVVTGEMFLEGHGMKDILGSERLAPFNMIKRLREYIFC